MAERYWELGNAITGFTVLQAIAFLYALSDPAKIGPIAKAFHKPVIPVACAFASLFYIGSIWLCYHAASLFCPGFPFMKAYSFLAWGQTAVVAMNTIGVGCVAWFILRAIAQDANQKNGR